MDTYELFWGQPRTPPPIPRHVLSMIQSRLEISANPPGFHSHTRNKNQRNTSPTGILSEGKVFSSKGKLPREVWLGEDLLCAEIETFTQWVVFP
jgi:hypothetical protein